MTLDRRQIPSPLNVGIIDLNGPAAFAHYGLTPRDYPGLIPSVDTAIAIAGEPLVFRPWQRNLHLHAELALVIGRDVAPCEGGPIESAIAGYCLGLGIWDDAPMVDLQRKVERDVWVNRNYGYLIDGSRQQGRLIYQPEELPSIDHITLTLSMTGKSPYHFPQRDLIFDAGRALRECNKLMGFCRGDVICLGPTAAPLVISIDEKIPAGAMIRVEGDPFEPLTIPVVDERTPTAYEPWPGCEVDFLARYPHLREPPLGAVW